jgi:hypothetical protein
MLLYYKKIKIKKYKLPFRKYMNTAYFKLSEPSLKSQAHLKKTMVTTKSKLQMEFNKEVTSASSGLVYVCFDSFFKVLKGLSNSRGKTNLSLFYF